MKYGEIICDPTSPEAKALVGRNVVASGSWCHISSMDVETYMNVLVRIDPENEYPFVIGTDKPDSIKLGKFIREVKCIPEKRIKREIEWIPASSTPDDDGQYLVTYRCDCGAGLMDYVDLATFNDDKKWYISAFDYTDSVSAWANLPAPYKEDE